MIRKHYEKCLKASSAIISQNNANAPLAFEPRKQNHGIPVSRIQRFLALKLVLQRFLRSFLLMAKILQRLFGVGYRDLKMILPSGPQRSE